jgi:hypothetical protein
MYRIITLDHSLAGIPEDGFGIDDGGNLFVAISKNGFSKKREAIIFLFVSNKIVVTHGKIRKIRRFSENHFETIRGMISDFYETQVLERVLELHLFLSGRRKINLNEYTETLKINKLISNILTKVYKFVGKYYGKTRVNLKKHYYQDFLSQVKISGFI